MTLLGTTRLHTTSYHRQSNGIDERFHRQLKTALKAQCVSQTWTEALPLVLLGIRTSLKEDLHCTVAELVYGMTLRLPGEFFTSSSQPVTPNSDYITRLKQYMSSLRAVPPRHNARKSFIQSSLLSASHVFIRRDSVKKPLQQPYDGPYKVLSPSDKYFLLDVNGKHETVSIDRLKAAPVDMEPPVALSHSVTPSLANASHSTTTSLHQHTRSGRRVHFPDRLNL